MSTFRTEIPIHLDKIKALLPLGSTIDRFEWNEKAKKLEMFWRNGKLQTKYNWPWPWTMKDLAEAVTPTGVEPVQPPEVQPRAVLEPLIAKLAQNRMSTNPPEEPPVEGIIRRVVNAMTKPGDKIAVAQEKVLTPQKTSAKTRLSEKAVGKTSQSKSKALPSVGRRSGVAPSVVARDGQPAALGVSTEPHGPKASDPASGSALSKCD